MDLNITSKTERLRRLFIISMIVFFAIMMYIMNLSYNTFNRNPSINSVNIELIEKYLSPEEQSFLIAEVIDVSLFMKFIRYDNFVLMHYQEYNRLMELDPTADPEVVVNSFETLDLTMSDYQTLLEAYSVSQLHTMKTVGSTFNPDAEIVFRPQDDDALVNDDHYIYSYSPRDLVEIPTELTLNEPPVYIEEHVLPHVLDLCNAAAARFADETCGGMQIFSGYRSYEDQTILYNYYIELGVEDPMLIINYPGHSEKQLGKSIYLSDIFFGTDFVLTEKAQFIRDNAHKYGFILRYPEGKEKYTNKTGDVSSLRYVGVELATKMKIENLTLEQYYEKYQKPSPSH